MMNHLTNLSEHFGLAELCKTNTGIENVPNEEQVNNLRRVCQWLEQLRRRWNNLYGDGDDPIIINSGFRSPEVNKAVGGVATSNHLTGCAVDIRCIGMEQALRYAAILLDIEDNPARQQCNRWMTHGFIERIKQGKYRKIIKDLMI